MPRRSRLYQLASGDWLDLQTIIEVKALPRIHCEFTNCTFPDRVVVLTELGRSFIVSCETWDDAEALRDTIAKEANAS